MSTDVPVGRIDAAAAGELFGGGTRAPRRLGPLARCRQLFVAWWIQLKMLAVDPFTGLLQVVWPLFFATAAFLLYRQTGDPSALVYAALGAGVMGTWSAVATTASGALQRERWLGTLELVVSTPTPFAYVLLPITTAMASLGTYSLVATLLWGRLAFGVRLEIADPFVFVLGVVATILAVSMFGFLLAVTVVRYRSAWALGNLLEYPGWLVCGFLVPLSILPAWVGWVGRALPPTWGMAAIRAAADGGSPWHDVLLCLGLGAAYAVVASLVAGSVLRSARRHATLSLT